ncbi:hypothetical protein [Dasania marina]|uniref:hypothetical protein n=1 Tax=Dasania marina TaxID=471499 RepID=UPI0030DCF422|tara:strand:- start:7815 stop:8048 length:234 start_codon:yes stop_codon:yes gene_type:complete
MTIRSLAEVGARLEEIVSDLLGEDAVPQQRYLHYEMIAIEILDSEFGGFPDGVLEEYLQAYLHIKRLELSLDVPILR